MTPLDLKPFAEKAFEALGAVVESPSHESLDVLLPGPESVRFGGPDLLHLEFSAQAGRPAVALGSPLLERLIEAVSEKGFLSRAYLNPLHLTLHEPQEKLARKIRILNAKLVFISSQIEEGAHGIFNFKVSYLTDDKQERLVPVAVNLATGQFHEGLLQEWGRLFLDSEPAYAVSARFELPDLDEACARAWEGLEKKIEEEVGKVRALQEKFLARDLARIEDYYGGLLRELSVRERRLEGDAAGRRKDAWEQRRKAIGLERQKKAIDARDKHQLEVEGALVNLLVLYQPLQRAVFRLRTREGDIERAFFWDPVLKEFDPPVCDQCRRFDTSLRVENRKLICSNC